MAGINLARRLEGKPVAVPPPTTMLGGLYRYLHEADPAHFQPMNANYGLFPAIAGPARGRARREALGARAAEDASRWMAEHTLGTAAASRASA